MNIFDKFIQKIALLLIAGILIIVPVSVWYYERVYLPSKYPQGAKVFTIYFDGTKNWSLKRIAGDNYWRRKHEVLKDIRVKKGDTVVLRLLSTDVYHGFKMDDFGIEVGKIKPGHVQEVTFTADKVGSFDFQCTRHCGDLHKEMKAKLVVESDEP